MITLPSGPHIVKHLQERVESLKEKLDLAQQRIDELESAFGTEDEILPIRMMGLTPSQARIAHMLYRRPVSTPDQLRQAIYINEPDRRFDVQAKTLDVFISNTRKRLRRLGIEIKSVGSGIGYRMLNKARFQTLLASKARFIAGNPTDRRVLANRLLRAAE